MCCCKEVSFPAAALVLPCVHNFRKAREPPVEVLIRMVTSHAVMTCSTIVAAVLRLTTPPEFRAVYYEKIAVCNKNAGPERKKVK